MGQFKPTYHIVYAIDCSSAGDASRIPQIKSIDASSNEEAVETFNSWVEVRPNGDGGWPYADSCQPRLVKKQRLA